MKKYLNLKFKIQIAIINCMFLFGCITEYEATGIDEVSDILVVEGFITDDESIITLSRSGTLTGSASPYNYVDFAVVYVESDDGTRFYAEPHRWWDSSSWLRNGRYTIRNGNLNPNNKYRLVLEIEESDGDCDYSPLSSTFCPTNTYIYHSDYSHPIKTPEIDSIFWMKRGAGQPVMIYVATHSPDNKIMYYRWSYKEDWEVHSEIEFEEKFPFFCWNLSNSRDLLLGSAERTVFGRLTDKIVELSPSNRRFSVLYRITVKQHAISKRAYDYFSNIKKNAEQTGSIFAPIPSELRGNITCITDPDRPVIGYVDVSSSTHKQRYISHREVYEPPRPYCYFVPADSLLIWYPPVPGILWDPPEQWILFDPEWYDGEPVYVLDSCVDCSFHGTQQKPEG